MATWQKQLFWGITHVKATHRDSTSAAQHKTQGERKADRWKIDVREGESTRLLFVFLLPNLLIIIVRSGW